MNSVDIAEDTDLACVAQRALSEMPQIRPVLDKIADKWTILILIAICPRPARFNEIKRRLNGITHKALADALKRLERNGFVTRTVLPTAPIGVEYAITPLGHSLRQPFEALCGWALANGREIDEAAERYDNGRNPA
ncbi:winged helix-turn-helix transcriptional regulator [Stakelama pacifica]|uniref:HxlR family transcriptional regulator n=1 Tax=Stakelama pacifica TaxID=517720 RepID=A0A4R6FBV9_9SPHN|nr:helix-turn-helix domain-containing protein [Stakelama pacifica]TDN78080.1 HxlR family transcriptional regulator [Stakelama pacifica]GGP00411.1 HxlR family transcriptional regulator [Stakelama pacifica]